MFDQLSRIRPVLTHLGVFILTLIFAALWGRNISNIDNTGLWQLDPSYQGIYVQAVADAYAQDGDAELAADRLSYVCQEGDPSDLQVAFSQAEQRYGSSPAKQANLESLRTLVQEGSVTQNQGVSVCSTKPVVGFVGQALPIVGLFAIALGIVGYGVYMMMEMSEESPMVTTQPTPSDAAPAAEKEEKPSASRAGGGLPGIPFIGGKKEEEPAPPASAAARGAAISAEVERTDFESQGVRPPIVQFMTTYLHGDELYDDSFSIETSSGEFLGETGVGISETISSEDGSKRVTAFEVWLFDKNDIRTVTKVIMSDHTFNDQAMRDKLKAKGDAVLAEPGKKITLETATMRVQARVVDMSYGSGPTPPNSYFDRLTIELAAWKRENVS